MDLNYLNIVLNKKSFTFNLINQCINILASSLNYKNNNFTISYKLI